MIYRTRDEMLKVLGENLRASRLADNLSQQTAAERSGISLKAIRNLEAGENASTHAFASFLLPNLAQDRLAYDARAA